MVQVICVSVKLSEGGKSIDLNPYFTTPCNRKYTAIAQAGKHISLTVSNDLQVKVSTLDPSWMGAETVNIDLFEEGEMIHTYSINFEQIHPASSTGETLALLDFAQDTVEAVTNQIITLQANAVGADTFEWTIAGAERSGSELAPNVRFAEPGTYFAVLQISNATDTIIDSVKISIIGITAASHKVCKGSSIELSASVTDAAFLWDNGKTSQSITVAPTHDTAYILTITKGTDVYVDTFAVHVIKPFKEELSLVTVRSCHEITFT